MRFWTSYKLVKKKISYTRFIACGCRKRITEGKLGLHFPFEGIHHALLPEIPFRRFSGTGEDIRSLVRIWGNDFLFSVQVRDSTFTNSIRLPLRRSISDLTLSGIGCKVSTRMISILYKYRRNIIHRYNRCRWSL